MNHCESNACIPAKNNSADCPKINLSNPLPDLGLVDDSESYPSLRAEGMKVNYISK